MTTEWNTQIRSTEVDGDGIVNNAHYFEFFEQARLELLDQVGPLGSPDASHARRFTIAESTCRFKAPLRFRDRILVRCWVSAVRVRSFDLAYEIRMQESDMLAAEGTSAQVWLDASGHPSPLPEDLRRRLEDAVP